MCCVSNAALHYWRCDVRCFYLCFAVLRCITSCTALQCAALRFAAQLPVLRRIVLRYYLRCVVQ